MGEEQVKCPKCGSTEIRERKRGWSFWTGMIGRNKIIRKCAKCGHKLKHGEGG